MKSNINKLKDVGEIPFVNQHKGRFFVRLVFLMCLSLEEAREILSSECSEMFEVLQVCVIFFFCFVLLQESFTSEPTPPPHPPALQTLIHLQASFLSVAVLFCLSLFQSVNCVRYHVVPVILPVSAPDEIKAEQKGGREL